MTSKTQFETTISRPLSRFGLITAMLFCMSGTSAFQCIRGLSVDSPTSSLRAPPAGSYDNDVSQMERSPMVVSTRLQYRNGSDETATSSALKWLSTILPHSQRYEDAEQERVDDYLEFLDRRYRRLHNNEQEDANKPFSALDWLTQGSNRNDLIASKQQEEDALYVLGVAGLAGQRVLHRHKQHVPGDGKVEPSTVVSQTEVSVQQKPKMHVLDADLAQTGLASFLIKKVLVPCIRVIFVAQRRKGMFFNSQLRRATKLSKAALRSVARAVVSGPAVTAKAVLEVGGGRKSIAVTMATVSTLLLLLRPVIQTVIAEGAVSP